MFAQSSVHRIRPHGACMFQRCPDAPSLVTCSATPCDAGSSAGSVLKLPRQGHDGFHGGVPGDLYLLCTADQEDVHMRRTGPHLLSEVQMPVWDAILGATLPVLLSSSAVQGPQRVQVPPGELAASCGESTSSSRGHAAAHAVHSHAASFPIITLG